MPANAQPLNEMLPIDSDDHTLEVDTRSLLTDAPELDAHMESPSAHADYDDTEEYSGGYEDPRLGDVLTATQVIQLLTLGK